ncbi:MAG: adenine nucleotide alpha hydrolase family protein [Actinobacteria bacterium]|nr:adenine nucleotide alpha hydrolase family protein [Actinomycetota bacterium]
MKCRTCRNPAIIDLPRHNANFCAEHLLQLCRRQVEKAIHDHQMFEPTDHLLVAVSGGKDSLAVWDILRELGYRTTGLYIALGIGEYSHESQTFAEDFAARRGLPLVIESLRDDHGFDVPTAARATGRVPCSACGMSKRHIFDRVARDGGYDAVVTGHNLDDEAAVLFGNALRWDVEYLARQLPLLPARGGFPRKAKPLVRLTERETAAWCIVRGIDYIVDECPMAAGNKHLAYKQALNLIEEESPGAKATYYLGFLERMAPLLSGSSARRADELASCVRCGSPTGAEVATDGSTVCAFCRLSEKARGHEPVPVEMLMSKSARRAAAKEARG